MISSTTRTAGPYAGNGSQTVFPFNFVIFAAADLLVQQTDNLGNVTTLTLTSQYSVTLNSNQNTTPGGTVNLTTATPTGYTLNMSSQEQALQPVNLTNSGNFYPQVINNALDYITILIQQILTRFSGLLSFPLGDPASAQLPAVASRANNLLGFDSNGNAVAVTPAAGTASALSTSLLSAIGSTLVSFLQAGTGAVVRLLQNKLREQLSVTDFGADPTYAADSTAAFNAAINYLQLNANYRGGTIHVPRGHYMLSSTLALTAYATGQVHNIYFSGEGPDNTVLDFAMAGIGTDGITFNQGAHFGVENLCIQNAKRDGLSLNIGAYGTANFSQNFYIRNVRIQACGRYGLLSYNCFMGELSDIWSFSNTSTGIVLGGFHTSLDVRRCWSELNGVDGWDINGVAYSAFTACGADTNTGWGWTFQNCTGVAMNGCGAESNGKDPFYALTQTVSNASIPAQNYGIHGLVFTGCFTTSNSTLGAGTYSSFLGVSTANGIPAEIKINGGIGWPNTVSDVAIVLAGTSGQITLHKELFNDSGFTAADVLSGSYEVKNLTQAGRRTLAQLSSAQSLASGTTTVAAIATLSTNDLGCTISSNQVVVPRGINKVRVSVGADFAANATGVRQVYVQHNSVGGLGLPVSTVNAVASGDTVMSLTSSVVSVVAGDTFSFQVYQNSGAALNLSNTNYTYIEVEAVS